MGRAVLHAATKLSAFRGLSTQAGMRQYALIVYPVFLAFDRRITPVFTEFP